MVKIFDYRDDIEYAKTLDQMVLDEFPKQANRVRSMINDILKKYNRHKWRVFNQQAADRYQDLSSLNCTHLYISQLLAWQDEGEEMPDHYIEASLRNMLGLPFKSIEGSSPDEELDN